jgi:hypothetical protein
LRDSYFLVPHACCLLPLFCPYYSFSSSVPSVTINLFLKNSFFSAPQCLRGSSFYSYPCKSVSSAPSAFYSPSSSTLRPLKSEIWLPPSPARPLPFCLLKSKIWPLTSAPPQPVRPLTSQISNLTSDFCPPHLLDFSLNLPHPPYPAHLPNKTLSLFLCLLKS